MNDIFLTRLTFFCKNNQARSDPRNIMDSLGYEDVSMQPSYDLEKMRFICGISTATTTFMVMATSPLKALDMDVLPIDVQQQHNDPAGT